jgi:hypothetical protein
VHPWFNFSHSFRAFQRDHQALITIHKQDQHPRMSPQVTITTEGRSGSVIYTAEGGRISGWWEFGGGQAIAIANMGGAAEWERVHPWAVAERGAILQFIAQEMIRQKASGCRANIDEESGWIEIVR